MMITFFTKSRLSPISTTWFAFIVVVALVSCGSGGNHRSEIAYPSPVPDSVPLVFLPELVSTDSFDFNAAFSVDGRSYYFSRRVNKQSDIFVTRFEAGAWTTPLAMPFNMSAYSDADPAIDRDGKIYFISNRPRDAMDTLLDYDIWYAAPKPDGGWNLPELLSIVNSDSSEFYISFAGNGNLYFASSRGGGLGEEDIYVSPLIEGKYSAPVNLGPGVNSEKSEYDPGISPDERIIVFTSPNRDDTFGGGDLYGSATDGSNGGWRKAVHLGKKWNTAAREFCSYFSPDSRYFFYSGEGNVKWVKAGVIKNEVEKKTNN